MDGSIGTTPPAAIATSWAEAFGAARAAADAGAIAACFATAEAHWRDIVALGWDIRTTSGAAAIGARFAAALPALQPRAVRLAEGRTPPRRLRRGGAEVVEAILSFETAVGQALGVVRLVPRARAMPPSPC